MNFNTQGQREKFVFFPLDQGEKAYSISMFKDYKGPSGMYDVVGTYEVVDATEKPEVTEKKVSNVVKMLSGMTSIENLSHLTHSRLLFELVPRVNDFDPTVIHFRTYDGRGVSNKNAVLKLEKGILYERSNK